ncbi:uncharacterized protein LOC123557522 isoform X1 [Mercenaria mercenaria]|uniref:uncharacterized protein LOC123557522 isoform X1 n=1 Tax=Mercenaria mercenaria TaxID=6596 RepID=UPI00234E5B8D|nr:uncharacterized protein LOC123557522 isoform X1 [Mercenaria mercenaria]
MASKSIGKRPILDIRFIHKELKKHNDTIRSGIKGFENNDSLLFFVRILSCNGAYSSSFTDAWCETQVDFSKGVSYRHLFDIGILEQFLETCDLPASLDENLKYCLLLAFQTLADFMDDYEETEKLIMRYANSKIKEVYWTGVFGTHVIKKLSSAKKMTISDCGYEFGAGAEECLCGCGEELVYGDTSMGHADVWHGSVDILVPNVAVNVTPDIPVAGFEMETDNLEKYRRQLIPKAIVTSCSMHSSKPLIAISKSNMKLLLYDFDSDILFESEEFYFKESLTIVTILGLWLAINNVVFGLDINPAFKKTGCQSGFKAFIQEARKLDIYGNQMHLYGCKEVPRIGRPISEIISEIRRNRISLVMPE